MKIKITKSVLLDSLKKVQNAAPVKPSVPVLKNVLIIAKDGKITMTCTDLDISIVSSATCEVEEEGASTLPIELLVSSISKLSEGTINFSVDEKDNAQIVCNKAKFKIVGISQKEFPNLPEDTGDGIEIPQNVLKEMIRQTQYASSKDDTRRVLCGSLFSFSEGKFTMVSTDGRRLAIREFNMDIPEGFNNDYVIPSKTIIELSKLLNGDDKCKITVSKSQVAFDLGIAKLYSKLLDDAYPNYRQVVPKETKYKAVMDRQQVFESIDRVAVLAKDESAAQIKLSFSNGITFFNAKTTTNCEATDEIANKFDGENIDSTFNPYYILDALKVIDEDEVELLINNGSSPIIIKKANKDDFTYVLMPLRVQ